MNDEQRRAQMILTNALATEISVRVGNHQFIVKSTAVYSSEPEKLQAMVFTDDQCEKLGKLLTSYIPEAMNKVLGLGHAHHEFIDTGEDNDGQNNI